MAVIAALTAQVRSWYPRPGYLVSVEAVPLPLLGTVDSIRIWQGGHMVELQIRGDGQVDVLHAWPKRWVTRVLLSDPDSLPRLRRAIHELLPRSTPELPWN